MAGPTIKTSWRTQIGVNGERKIKTKPQSWLRKNGREERMAVWSWRLVCVNMLYEILKELARTVFKKRNKGNKLGICTKGNCREYGITEIEQNI